MELTDWWPGARALDPVEIVFLKSGDLGWGKSYFRILKLFLWRVTFHLQWRHICCCILPVRGQVRVHPTGFRNQFS